LSKGVMVAVVGRLVHAVVSRCRLPVDGDILVPQGASGGSTVMGTTDALVTDPDDGAADDAAVGAMLTAGDELVPGFSSAGPVRAWAAVRPLVGDAGGPASASGGRQVSRSHRVIDHGEHDGVAGLITITGGKATTFRLMAEDAVDAVCLALGSPRPCRTALEELPAEGGMDVAR
jgi:glycerol-3-phosphate dehydrogenase